MKEVLQKEATALNITLSDAQLNMFETYYKMLIEYNKFVNLTRVTSAADVAKKHFADSLALVSLIPYNARVIDVGTGAGFPGLPLAVYMPGISVTLLDSLKKRVSFLNDVVSAIGLSGINVIHARAEDAAHGEHREGYDIALSRAVASMPVLCEYCLPFVKPGGSMIACKGENSAYEPCENAMRVLGGANVSRVTLDVTGLTHYAVVIKKLAATPAMYPRKAGIPAKTPL